MPKNTKMALTSAQFQALPISVNEARKLLGSEAQGLTDDEVAVEVLSINELAIYLINNINLHKMHL